MRKDHAIANWQLNRIQQSTIDPTSNAPAGKTTETTAPLRVRKTALPTLNCGKNMLRKQLWSLALASPRDGKGAFHRRKREPTRN